ncbi:MAG: methanogenesis marker 2 protein [Candidatus Methanomethylophilus sp.]|nr:methanogenesis marker 2 protein [Methanomethylophilus sp.]
MNMELQTIIDSIRNFPGVTRKSKIHEVVDLLPTDAFPRVAAAEGEDAAAIEMGDSYVLFATDGIMESLVQSDPYMAGYFAVLVNVNDIAAMGGRATAMVDVVSMSDNRICGMLLRGMEEGVRRFGVPIVGGHTHPDCNYHAIDISIIGEVKKDCLIRSCSAKPGDDVVFVMDLDGHYPDNIPYAWLTTLDKDPKLVKRQMEAAAIVADEKLAHAGKDMSNPGSVGTLGMLLEASEMGAQVDLNRIPVPKDCTDFVRWLLCYQGCGFVYTCPPENSERIIEIFRKVKCEGAVVGKVNDTRKLELAYNGEKGTLFDFSSDIITGCKPKQHLPAKARQ